MREKQKGRYICKYSVCFQLHELCASRPERNTWVSSRRQKPSPQGSCQPAALLHRAWSGIAAPGRKVVLELGGLKIRLRKLVDFLLHLRDGIIWEEAQDVLSQPGQLRVSELESSSCRGWEAGEGPQGRGREQGGSEPPAAPHHPARVQALQPPTREPLPVTQAPLSFLGQRDWKSSGKEEAPEEPPTELQRTHLHLH